ncbi:hypothetical protein ACP4OV_023338 [Aristida adscensionis]
MEVARTLAEMAEVASLSFHHSPGDGDELLLRLRAEEEKENAVLRARLADDHALLHDLHAAAAPNLSVACPPDLYSRLLAAVDDSSFVDRVEMIRQQSAASQDAILSSSNMAGLEIGDVPQTASSGGKSSWVFLSCDSGVSSLEEISGIDSDSYVIVNEDDIVDGIASFVARCIIEDPKSKLLSPMELQKVVVRALSSMKDERKWRSIWEAGKVIYTLTTWGITLIFDHVAVESFRDRLLIAVQKSCDPQNGSKGGIHVCQVSPQGAVNSSVMHRYGVYR